MAYDIWHLSLIEFAIIIYTWRLETESKGDLWLFFKKSANRTRVVDAFSL